MAGVQWAIYEKPPRGANGYLRGKVEADNEADAIQKGRDGNPGVPVERLRAVKIVRGTDLPQLRDFPNR